MGYLRKFLFVAAVVSLSTGAAAATTDGGMLSFDEVPLLQGTLGAQGGGELALVPGQAPFVGISGRGDDIVVRAVRTQDTEVGNPVGGPVSLEPPSEDGSETMFASATLRLSRVGEDFRMLLFGGDVSVAPFDMDGRRLHAYADPALILDEYAGSDQAREGETKVFTYTADGDRFPVLVPAGTMSGSFTLFLWDATLVVVDAEGASHQFVSGSSRETTTPGTTREVNEYHLIEVGSGSIDAVSTTLVAWLSQPEFTLQGRIVAPSVSGSLDVDADAHHLDHVPATIVGDLVVRPAASGRPVAPERDGLHVGTSMPSGGVYPESRAGVSGDVTVLAIGTQNVLPAQPQLPVLATTVGLLALVGAALAFAPKVKWSVLGVLAPLYAKTQRDRLLDNGSRDRLFHAICENPGINLSQVRRVAELGWGATVYHLKMMEKKGLIFSEAAERDRCFFENAPRLRQMREAIAVLANKAPAQRIAEVIAKAPGLTQSEVIAATGMTQRSVSYHLGRLTRKQLVASARDRNFTRYAPTDRLLSVLTVLGIVATPPAPEPVALETPLAVPLVRA